MDSEEEEGPSDWIFDTVQTVFTSPTWEVPILNFVDEHCAAFHGEEENNIEHSRLHDAFRAVAEDLLVTHLSRVGVTTEQFVEACERGRNSRGINKNVWSQICAIDDFLTCTL